MFLFGLETPHVYGEKQESMDNRAISIIFLAQNFPKWNRSLSEKGSSSLSLLLFVKGLEMLSSPHLLSTWSLLSLVISLPRNMGAGYTDSTTWPASIYPQKLTAQSSPPVTSLITTFFAIESSFETSNLIIRNWVKAAMLGIHYLGRSNCSANVPT